jgi:hypothetical protein
VNVEGSNPFARSNFFPCRCQSSLANHPKQNRNWFLRQTGNWYRLSKNCRTKADSASRFTKVGLCCCAAVTCPRTTRCGRKRENVALLVLFNWGGAATPPYHGRRLLRQQGAIEALGWIGGESFREQNGAVRVEQQSGWRPVHAVC